MDQTLWLYIIKLEQDKYFLYDTYCNNEFEVLVISHINHEYLKKYKPIDIKEIVILEDHIEILYYLKKYMSIYGIDAVRGGPYTKEFLTSEESQFLENELNINTHKIENQMKEDSINTIIKKYGMTHWTQNEIDEEVQILESIQYSYKKDFKNIKQLDWIKESILYDISWMRRICSHNSNIPYLFMYKYVFYNKYYRIIENLKKITELYFIYNETDESHIENVIFVKHPEFIFDQYVFKTFNRSNETFEFIQSSDINNESEYAPSGGPIPNLHCYTPRHKEMSTSYIDKLCDQFEIMANTLINRRMEYQFHIDSYIENVEWYIERAIYFLTNYSKLII
jgi:hypothetical protein